MKIDFSQITNPGQISHSDIGYKSSAQHAAAASGASAASFVRMDISNASPSAASDMYDSKGLTQTGSMSGVAMLDMSVQHNYFAVMSNTLSDEDYGRLMEDGFHPSDMTGSELVTVVDQIKLKLAQSGSVISGYNDDMSRQDIIKAGGDVSMAARIESALRAHDLPVTEDNINGLEEVLSQGEHLRQAISGGVPEGSIRYLTESDMELSLENVSRSLSGPPAVPLPLDEESITQLKPQMEEVIRSAGFEADEDSLRDARSLLENRLPLTRESFLKYRELRELTVPEDEELLSGGAEAIARGQRGTQLLLVKNERIMTQAQLSMTSKANLALSGSDYYLDTSWLEAKLGDLESREANLTQARGTGMQQLYSDTGLKLAQLAAAPAAVMGDFAGRSAYSLDTVRHEGLVRAGIYERAGESYEALGTQVRTDLGDSIRKAFANVDDILEDHELPATEENRRAVRILGYNRMEITDENIAAVREADSKVTGLMRRLTPGAVMRLIKDGRDPMELTVDELSAQLDEYDESRQQQDERYARYLLRLEKTGEISPEERDGYIGIYRLFRQVERSDGAVIGSLVDQGAAISVKNLLSAVRSRRAAGMDYKVDDDFGGVERIIPPGNEEIDSQIARAFGSKAFYEEKNRQLLAGMDPGRIKDAVQSGDLTMQTELDVFADLMEDQGSSDAGSTSAAAQKAADEVMAAALRERLEAPAPAVDMLSSLGMDVTPGAVRAARALSENRGDVFRQLAQLGRGLRISELIEELDSPEDASGAVDSLVEDSLEDVHRAMEAPDMSYHRMDELMLISSQLSLIGRRAGNEDFEIPMEINGELTAVNLKLIRGTGESSIRIDMETETCGAMRICLYPTPEGLDGYMAAATAPGEDYLRRKLEDLRGALEREGQPLSGSFSVIYSPRLDMAEGISSGPSSGAASAGAATGQAASASSAASGGLSGAGGIGPDILYKVAKTVLKTV